MSLNRRDFLSAALLLPALARQSSSERLVSIMPLGNPGGAAAPPFGRLLGDGLDARLFTDLSQLAASRTSRDAPRTSTEQFFVRTAAPSNLPPTDAWALRVGSRVAAPSDIRLRDLETHVGANKRVLIECSGNADQTNYGLMSTADWEGIPLEAVLDRIRPAAGTSRVLVSGIDDDTRAWRTSVAGASWIFTREQLQQAILAVRMNGAPLTRDHGFPARLIVPGWYGCSCIKWVDRIDLVPDDAPATSQMREFAARTHQPTEELRAGGVAPARDFIAASIDTAAMPVRVEKWLAGGRLEYRITGIIWGGTMPTNALSIRFRSGESVGSGRELPAAGVDADLEPLVAHLAAGSARPLSDRPARRRSRDPNAPARYLLLRPRDPDRRGIRRNRQDRRDRKATILSGLCALRGFFFVVPAGVKRHRASARISASSGRSLSARCHAARNSFAALIDSAFGPARLAALARPSSDWARPGVRASAVLNCTTAALRRRCRAGSRRRAPRPA